MKLKVIIGITGVIKAVLIIISLLPAGGLVMA